MRVKYKITIAFVVLTTIVLASLCFFTYFNTEKDQHNDFAKMLHNRALTISSLLYSLEVVDYGILSKVDSATKNLLTSENVNVFNNRNECIYRFDRNVSDSISIPIHIINQVRKDKYVSTILGNKQIAAIYYKEADLPIVVSVAAIDNNGKIKLLKLKNNLIYGFVIGVILSLFFGLYFSKRILYPLIQISKTVDNISASNIEEKLPTSEHKDEWDTLATTFNKLLARLKESFDMQGRFIANASHELSTPLTSVNNQIDVTLRKERTNEEYLNVLRSVRLDVQHMSALTQQLLNIARTSSGGAIQAEDVRIDELLMELPSKLKKGNQKYKASVFFDELPDEEELSIVKGNYELLLSAFYNLAENGCKYSSNNKVQISLSFVDNRILVLFTNLCDSLKEEDLIKLFQPFQRGVNTQNIEGYGLGLSLTRRIILLHKGEIKAELQNDDSIMISVVLPSSI